MALKLLLGMDKKIGFFPKGSGKAPLACPFLISCPLWQWRESVETLLSSGVSPRVPDVEGKRGLTASQHPTFPQHVSLHCPSPVSLFLFS